MDDELEQEEDANFVFNQEYSELLHILSNQSSSTIMKLYHMIPIDTASQTSSTSSPAEVVVSLLDYYRQADSAQCRDFFQRICLLCENIPMWLESRLMSVSGNPTNDCDISRRVTEPLEEQLIKRPRIDYWEQYITSVKSLLMKRWETIRKALVVDVELDHVWVSLRRANRARDRPDQTPVDRGSTTPDSDVEYGSPETKVTLDTFLQSSLGKVTVLYGPPGSGKTLHMSCLGELWARDLGPIPASHLFVLIEFTHLNLLAQTLSLYELLFQHYLPPEGKEDAKEAIVDYLLSNPEQTCWVLDGYEELKRKPVSKDNNNALFDPKKPLCVAELISGLLNGYILPGCTMVVTCCVRNATDLKGIADKVGQLQGWNHHEIRTYVDKFFKLKGDSAGKVVGKQAADLLLSSKHLVSMSTLPALCHISCMCLDYLLLEARKLQLGDNKGEKESGTKKEPEKTRKGVNSAHQENEKNSVEKADAKEDVLPAPEIPSTLTQIYLTCVGAFLSHYTDKRGVNTITGLSQGTGFLMTTFVNHYKSELSDLCELAWAGLQTRKILFLEKEIPNSILDFSVRTGFLSKTELQQKNRILVNVYSFIHLTVQEFLSALRMMTSADVSEKELKNRLSLRTRWPSKSDQKTVFTDNLHLYLSGLASPHCTAVLALLAKAGCDWVRKRQQIVLKLLQQFTGHGNLTGPKVLELCHCVQESQDIQLAKELMHTKPKLELHNITLSPTDLHALAFVVNSSDNANVGLDFGACSIELESLELLSQCQKIKYLSFHSRKYGDKFADRFSTILPTFVCLEKLNFYDASLTAIGAAHLASALPGCPCITKINLKGNNLKDEGVKHITDIITKLPQLTSVKLGQNNTSLRAAVYLVKAISSLNIQHIYIDGVEELTVSFCPNPNRNSHKVVSQAEIRLLNQKWNKSEMQKLGESLAQYPTISVLDLSGKHWKVETLKVLVQFFPMFNITKEIVVNGSCSSVEALVVLTALMSECTAVTELNIRLKSPAHVSLVFPGRSDSQKPSTSLSLSSCGLKPSSLERVLRSLGHSSDLTGLDLSSNSLGDEGVKKLLNGLHRLRKIREINASNNGVTMDGVVLLAGALGSHNSLIQVYTSHKGKEKTMLTFSTEESNRQLRIFRVMNSRLMPEDMTTLCLGLLHCDVPLELDLSHSPLNDDTINNLVKVLPKMTLLQTLNLSYCDISTSGAVLLCGSVIGSKRVKLVQLSSQRESIVIFDKEKQDQFICRFSNFSLDRYNLERLLDLLQSGPQLSELDLSNNNLGDETVKHFVNYLPRLRVTNFISLSNNCLQQQGLLEVASTLSTCNSVSGVDVCLGEDQKCCIWFGALGQEKSLSVTRARLSCNHQIQLAKIVSNCPSPFKLELRNSFSEYIESFVEMLDSSHIGCTVSIEEPWIRSKRAVSLLCRCLELNKNISSIGIRHTTLYLCLKKSSHLSSVSLVDCGVQGSQLALMEDTLHRCHLLEELDLSHNSLGEEGAEFLYSVLPSLPKLASLRVGSGSRDVDCVHFAEILCKALLQSKTIKYLSLLGYAISDTTFQHMTSVLPALKSLNLSHCSWSNSGGLQLMRSLTLCEDLEELCLDCVQLDEESIMCLAQSLKNIKRLHILKLGKAPTSLSVWEVLVAMEKLVQLEEIDLDGWRMGDKEVELLVRLLPLWTHLQKICLSQTFNSDTSGDNLLKVLQSCANLKELHLSHNNLGDLTTSRMSLVFQSLTLLSVLDISVNNIGQKGSMCLAKAISFLPNLTKINLTSAGQGVELCAVVASLANCPCIQKVNLGWNNCGDDVAKELARVLPLCPRMIKIDLEKNNISLVGAEALVKALQSCPGLETIRLWKNSISPGEEERISRKDKRISFSPT